MEPTPPEKIAPESIFPYSSSFRNGEEDCEYFLQIKNDSAIWYCDKKEGHNTKSRHFIGIYNGPKIDISKLPIDSVNDTFCVVYGAEGRAFQVMREGRFSNGVRYMTFTSHVPEIIDKHDIYQKFVRDTPFGQYCSQEIPSLKQNYSQEEEEEEQEYTDYDLDLERNKNKKALKRESHNIDRDIDPTSIRGLLLLILCFNFGIITILGIMFSMNYFKQ